MSATQDLPPEDWNPDGTITRPNHHILPAFNALSDRLHQTDARLELYAKDGKLAVLAIRKDGKLMAQKPFRQDLEAAAKALSK